MLKKYIPDYVRKVVDCDRKAVLEQASALARRQQGPGPTRARLSRESLASKGRIPWKYEDLCTEEHPR